MVLVESPSPSRPVRRPVAALASRRWVVVLSMAALTCLLGWLPFMNRPLSPDESGLLMVARQWGPGDSLYGDYWVDRPPLLIALVALGNALGGAWGLRLLGVITVFVTVVLAGVLGRTVAPRVPHAPLLPAATAALVLGSPLAGGSVVNAELLGLPLLLTGMITVILSARSETSAPALWWAFAAGAAGAGAALTKQNLLDVFVLGLALAVTGGLRMRDRDGGRAGAATVLGFAGGAGTMLAVAVGAAAALGTHPVELWSAVVTFRGEAAAVLLESPASGERMREMLLALLATGAPLLVGVLLLNGRRRRPGTREAEAEESDLRWPALAVLVWESVAVMAGGSYWLHYLMGLVPGLALLAAVVGLPDRRRVSLAIGYGLALVSTLSAILWVAVHPIDRSEQEVADFLAARAEPGDTAVVTFGVASILESSGLESPYPNLWSLPVRVRDPDLEAFAALLAGPDRPTWLVISGIGLGTWGVDTDAAQPLIKQHYERIADVAGYRIFRELEDER